MDWPLEPWEFDWPMALLTDDPETLARAVVERARELDPLGRTDEAIAALRLVFDKIGPARDVWSPREAVGRELISRQMTQHDVSGAMWTVGRLLTSETPPDWAWPWAMRVVEAVGPIAEEQTMAWWKRLEGTYEAVCSGAFSGPWDGLDEFVARVPPLTGGAPKD